MTDATGNSADVGILVFDSIHYVLAAEHALVDADLWCDLIPTPRSISSNCGMVLQFRFCHAPAVANLMAQIPRSPVAAYRRVEGVYQPTSSLDDTDGK